MRGALLLLCLVAACADHVPSRVPPVDLGDVDGANVNDDGGVRPVLTPPPPGLSIVAGTTGGRGTADGTGERARFTEPARLCVMAGVLYVADQASHVVRAITLPSGEVRTLAGIGGIPGRADGVGAAARFDTPIGITGDGAGNLYVVESGNLTVRRISVADGTVSTVAGKDWGSADGIGEAAQFGRAEGITYDRGFLYVADTSSSTIRAIELATRRVTTLAGAASQHGSDDKIGAEARFAQPEDVLADGAGGLYVADFGNGTLRHIDLATRQVSTIAGKPGERTAADGAPEIARLEGPRGLALDGAGHLYVADTANSTVRSLDLATRHLTTLAGDLAHGEPAWRDGTGAAARFYRPDGVAFVGGDVYVADTVNGLIRRIDGNRIVSTAFGAPVTATSQLGKGPRPFGYPHGVAVHGGTAYVADAGWHVIQGVDLASGSMSVVDSFMTGTTFYHPVGVVADAAGRLFVSQWKDHIIRELDPTTQVSMLVGGAYGQPGFVDGERENGRFGFPGDLALDGKGGLYVADTWNSAIRKIDLATGSVRTVAKGGGFLRPRDVELDESGEHLFVADAQSFAVKVIKLADESVRVLAGKEGEHGWQDGLGEGARFRWPIGLAYDRARGFLYVADQMNNAVRRIVVASGEVSTVVGVAGQGGVEPGPLPARLNQPTALALTGEGDLLITDHLEQILLRARFIGND